MNLPTSISSIGYAERCIARVVVLRSGRLPGRSTRASMVTAIFADNRSLPPLSRPMIPRVSFAYNRRTPRLARWEGLKLAVRTDRVPLIVRLRSSPRLSAVCLAFALLLGLSACSVSQSDERAIGTADAAQVDSQLPLVHDSVITEYIAALGKSMASRTSRADLDWQFAVVNSPEVNAFAIPGGFVYVNRGAIEQADSLDELAGIMGHEIGHVVRRHSVNQMEKQERGRVGLVLLCTLTSVCRTAAGRIAIGVGADAVAASYSQHDEAEADSEGVVNTLAAGIDPEGLPAFFQKLLEQQKSQPSVVEAFFSTHPTDASRVAATRKQIAALHIPADRKLMRDTPEFHVIQARVRALPVPPPDTAR
jgi:predicted Zn-dependent protease